MGDGMFLLKELYGLCFFADSLHVNEEMCVAIKTEDTTQKPLLNTKISPFEIR